MPRRSKPWYRASRGRWYATMYGKQVDLGVTDPRAEARALEVWRAMLEQGREGGGTTVAQKVAEYLERAARRVNARTLVVYRWYLGEFGKSFGARRTGDLTAEQLEDDARRASWSPSTRNTYLGTVQSFLAWCGVKLRIKKPPKQSAGAKNIVADETYHCLLTHLSGDWRAIVVFLWETGCRPQEAAGLTVEQVDWDQRVARLADHKTAAHGGDRIIYLSRKAYAVAEQQRQRYRTGLLFRSKVGTRFRSQAFVRKFRRLSRRVGKRVCAYSFRHSFATRALADGESDTIVAELMGHHSTQMIHRHYKSASAMGRQLRDAADRIGKRAS